MTMRSATDFNNAVSEEIYLLGGHSWRWKKDIHPWLRDVLRDAKFDDDKHDWSINGAKELAVGFMEEASTL